MIFLAFFGAPRMSRDAAHHVHESPPTMTVPLMVLALLTIIAGWAVGVPSDHGTRFARFLGPVFPLHEEASGGIGAYMLLILSVIVVAAGIVLAWLMYMAKPVRAESIGRAKTPLPALLLNAYYVDWLYDRLIVQPLYQLSVFMARLDLGVIDGIVNLVGRSVVRGATALRQLQTGYVVNYALTMLVGAVVLVGYLLTRR
jgi:NADH-quinone oxidoreductase subunit L